MESLRPLKKELVPRQESTVSFEAKLRDVITARLDLLSEKGKEKVLDYINSLIDLEEKQLEFSRRQGRLYHWVGNEEREIQP